jgi:hypothetical protein
MSEPTPDRTATRLLLIALEPTSGRLRNPRVLDVGLRAGMFADLIQLGRIVSDGHGPVPTRDEPTGDRLLDAVFRTVSQRPKVAWKRWYRHVRVDREAGTAELVEQGRWRSAGRVTPTYLDLHPQLAQAARQHTAQVITLRTEPDDAQDAALALIAAITGVVGGPRRPAKAIDRELAGLLPALGASEQVRRDVRQCIYVAAKSMKRELPGQRGLAAAEAQ